MLSMSILGILTPTVPTLATEIIQTNNIQMDPLVTAFIKKIQKNLVLDENYHATYLTEEATDKQIQEAYSEAIALVVNHSNGLSEKDKQIISQLSNELLKAMHNELKKPANQSYENEKISFYQQQINDLFNDPEQKDLNDNVTDTQLMELFQNFIEYESERRDRDENTMNNISSLFESLNHAILLYFE